MKVSLIWSFFIFFFVLCYTKHFYNKLLSLLVLEAIFLYMILYIISYSSLYQGLNFYVISSFMVLDSMLGITLLVCSTRNTSFLSSLYYSF